MEISTLPRVRMRLRVRSTCMNAYFRVCLSAASAFYFWGVILFSILASLTRRVQLFLWHLHVAFLRKPNNMFALGLFSECLFFIFVCFCVRILNKSAYVIPNRIRYPRLPILTLLLVKHNLLFRYPSLRLASLQMRFVALLQSKLSEIV